MKRKVDIKIFIIVTLILASANIGQWVWPRTEWNNSDTKKIEAIHSFLDKISDSYINDIKDHVQKEKLPSWGCGPASYALAQIIDAKFFDNQLVIDALYDNEPYEIIERFGLVQYDQDGKKIISDHAWIEIYLKDKILFIDPTIGQYGGSQIIAFQEFSIGDPTIKTYLREKYNIIDFRISLLVRKSENNIPTNEQPYPGFSIDPKYIDYYKQANNIRNIVSIGREPAIWKDWVDYLTSKYSSI